MDKSIVKTFLEWFDPLVQSDTYQTGQDKESIGYDIEQVNTERGSLTPADS